MTFAQLLSRLARHWPIIAAITNSALLLIGIFIFRQFQKARVAAPKGSAGGSAPGEGAALEVDAEVLPPAGIPSAQQIRRTVHQGAQLLRERVTSRALRFRTPCFLILGSEGAGKSTLVRQLLPEAVAPIDSTEAHGCRWHFFDRAVTLEVDGRLLLSEDTKASAQGWAALHRALRFHRPERPIDGVVLALPITDLVGPQRLDPDALVLRARALFHRLRSAQRILGVRVPLYLLVTKCDLLQGFQDLCAALPAEKHAESFGWSNPYALESVFVPEWIDEAFDSLASDLFEIQVELLTRGLAADPSELFQFSNAFGAVHGPLRSFTTELCRESAYQESFFFRGLYFTGDGTVDAGERMLDAEAAELDVGPEGRASALPPLPDSLAISRDPYFIRDLFERKIFGETGLSRPVSSSRLSRNRAILAMQAAILAIILIGGTGIWRANVVLQREAGLLLSVLTDIRTDLRYLDGQRTMMGEARRGEWSTALNDRVFPLLSSMARVNENRLASFFLPSSWASSLHWNISESMRQGFTHVVLPSMYSAMLAKADSLVAPAAPSAELGSASSTELTGYLSALGRFGRNVERYDTVAFIGARQTELHNMAELVLYLFDEELPPEFLENKRYHRMALWESYGQRITPRDRPDFTTDAIRRSEQLLRDAYDVLITRVEEINTRFQSAESLYRLSVADLAEFRRLRDDLGQIGRVLDGSESFWFEESEPMGAGLRALLDSIPTTPMTAGDRFRGEFGALFERVRREKLGDLNRRLGPFGEGADGGVGVALALSPNLILLQSALDTLFSQPFLTPPPAGAGRGVLPAGDRLRWEVATLDRALQDHAQFATFLVRLRTQELPGLTRLLEGLATVQLEARLSDALERAMHSEPPGYTFGLQDRERDLRTRIAAFQEPSRRLVQLLGIADELGMVEMYDRFSAIYLDQALGLLAEVDALLEEGAAYRPLGGTLATWQGGESAAFAAFRARDEEELERYLAQQRTRVRYLVDGFAAPLLGGLRSEALAPRVHGQGSAAGLIAKWSGLVEELDRYEARSGASSIEVLEHFIRAEMLPTGIEACAGGAERRSGGGGGDFFLLARNRLRDQLATRCTQITTSRARDGYDRVQRFFNTNLSGRFPFTSDPGSGTQEAELESLRHFYQLHDELKPYRSAITGSNAADFLARMDEVREALAPLLAPSFAPGAPLFEVEVAFRANRAEERGADQIVDWILALGEEPLRYRGGSALERSLWRPGAPTSLALRWALDSGERPISDGYTTLSIADREAFYRYEGRWSLVRLIEAHRVESGAPGQGDLLRFQIPTVRVLGTGAAPGPGAQLFVQLRLRDPEGRVIPRLPSFPVQAPNFAF